VYGLIREEYSFDASTKDLARHLYTRVQSGKVVILTDGPQSLLPALRKQWLKLARKVSKERSSTLDGSRIYELTGVITHMQNLEFTIKWPFDDYAADVYIVTAEQLLQWAPECRTIYITAPVELEKVHRITALMPKGALVVMTNSYHKRD
jgi:hypothetical protein